MEPKWQTGSVEGTEMLPPHLTRRKGGRSARLQTQGLPRTHFQSHAYLTFYSCSLQRPLGHLLNIRLRVPQTAGHVSPPAGSTNYLWVHLTIGACHCTYLIGAVPLPSASSEGVHAPLTSPTRAPAPSPKAAASLSPSPQSERSVQPTPFPSWLPSWPFGESCSPPYPPLPPPLRPPGQPEGGRPGLSPCPGSRPGVFSSLPSAHPLDRPSRRGAPAPGFVCAHRARPRGARDAPLPHAAPEVRPALHRRALAWPAQPPARGSPHPAGPPLPRTRARGARRPPLSARLLPAAAHPSPPARAPRWPPQPPAAGALGAARGPSPSRGCRSPCRRERKLGGSGPRGQGPGAGARYLSLLSRGSESAVSGAPASASSASPPPPAAWLPPPAAAGTVGARASRCGLCGAPLRLASPAHPAGSARARPPPLPLRSASGRGRAELLPGRARRGRGSWGCGRRRPAGPRLRSVQPRAPHLGPTPPSLAGRQTSPLRPKRTAASPARPALSWA